MKFAPAHSIRIVAFLALVMAGVSAHAGVVFGNLGATGSGAIAGTNTDYGPLDTDERLIAQGFTVSGSATLLDLESVTLGLFFDNVATASRTVSIYSTSGTTPGSSLFTSNPVTVGVNAKYTFPFSGATLTPGSTYWVVPSGPASWYFNSGNTLPIEQNASTYTYFDTLVQNPSSQWVDPTFASSYSVSVVAVPEPPALVLAGIAVSAGILGIGRRRQRQSR
jgi:hypothetical protein